MGLGFVLHRGGHYPQALVCHRQALAYFRGSGQYWEAMVLENLGFTYRALGQLAEARHAWSHAHHLYRAWHRTAEAEHLRRRLDALGEAPAGR